MLASQHLEMAADPSSTPWLTATGLNFGQNAFPMTDGKVASSSLRCLVAGVPWKPLSKDWLSVLRLDGQRARLMPIFLRDQPDSGAIFPAKTQAQPVNGSRITHQFSVLPHSHETPETGNVLEAQLGCL